MLKASVLSTLFTALVLLPGVVLACPDCALVYDLSEAELVESAGMAVDHWGTFYVADPSRDRIIRSRTAGGPLIEVWGERGFGPGQFRAPMDVAVGADGVVYVADTGNRRIQKFDRFGNQLLAWGTSGSAPGQFLEPVAVDVDLNGGVHVLDAKRRSVQVFSSEGQLLRIFLIGETEGGGFGGGHTEHFEQLAAESPPATRPSDLVVDRHGRVHVLFPDLGRIISYGRDGAVLRAWGSLGSGPGQFLDPKAIGVCPGSDMLYVSDPGNARVQLFTGTGYFVEGWNEIDLREDAIVRGRRPPGEHFTQLLADVPAVPERLLAPRGIGVNGRGRLYVVDEGSAAVIGFSFAQCPARTEVRVRPETCSPTVDPSRLQEVRVVIPGMNGFDPAGVIPGDVRMGEGIAPLYTYLGDVPYRTRDGGPCGTHPTDGIPDLVLTFDGADLLAAAGVTEAGETGEVSIYGHSGDGTPFWSTGLVSVGRTSVEDRDRDGDHFEQFAYELPTAAHVTVDVFDVAGRLVERVSSGTLPAGTHLVNWDSGGRPAGIYFARVRAGDLNVTRRIVVR